MKYIVIFLLVVIFCNCKNSVNTFSGGEYIPYNGPTTSSLSSIIDSIRIIPLETKEDILWGNKPILLHRDTSFYIIDKYGSRQIFRFSEKGKFLNLIGRIGRGPKEYLTLEDIYIDNQLEELYLQSSPGFSLYCYTKNGDFKWKKYTNITVQSFAVCSEGYWLYLGYNNPYSEERLLLTDTSLQVKKSLLPLKTKIFPIAGDPSFTYSESNLYFHEALNSQIFKLHNDTLIAEYQFDFKEHEIPQSYFKADNPLKAFDKLSKNGFANITNFWDDINHTIVEVIIQQDMNSSIIYGLKNKNTTYWSWLSFDPLATNLFANKVKGFSSCGQLILLISGNDLLEMKDEEKKLCSNIQDINLKELKPDQDMFVLLCTLKK